MSQVPSSRLPNYRHHKPTGRAVVTLCGRDIYLGKHHSRESRDAYDRLIAEWITCGRNLPPRFGGQLTVVEVCNAYRRHAEGHYRRGGELTKNYDVVVSVLKMLGGSASGRTPRSNSGPSPSKRFGRGS